MEACQAIKTNGERCNHRGVADTHPAAAHLRFCATHWTTYNRKVTLAGGHHLTGKCSSFVNNRHWCAHDSIPGSPMCEVHTQRRVGVLERLDHTRFVEGIVRMYLAQRPRLTWQEIGRLVIVREDLQLQDKYNVVRQTHTRMFPGEDRWWQVGMLWAWLHDGMHGPAPNFEVAPWEPVPLMPPPPMPRAPELGVLARDPQNTHTRVVSEHTNRGIDVLVAVPRTGDVATPRMFLAAWLPCRYMEMESMPELAGDIARWYMADTCISAGDQLYRRAMDGLYTKIVTTENAETRAELFRRAYEECRESVGMCCQGHLSRLCNVLVGFDDAFAPPVPKGEILQQKIATIAGLDVDMNEKVRQATAVFEELEIPESERAPWLEAF